MICDNCGYANPSGAFSCALCKAELGQDAYPMRITRRTKSAASDTQPEIPKRKGAARAVKAAVGAVMLIAAGLVCLLLFAGVPVTGGWYSERSGTALVFGEDGTARFFSLAGVEEGKYSYNRLAGQGSVNFGLEKDFKVDKDALLLGAAETYERAKEGFDAQEFVKGALSGYWSNKEFAEVIEIKGSGTAVLHTADGYEKGSFNYEVAEGEGVIDYYGDKAAFTASLERIEVIGAGTFLRESESFDIEAFMREYGNPLKGAWHDKSGRIGRFDFLMDKVFTLLSYGTIYEGSYRFDNKKDTGSLTVNGTTFDIRLNKDTLIIGQWELTREAVSQKGRESLFEQLSGVWYDASGNKGTLEFFMNGTVSIKSPGEVAKADCTFNPVTGEGIITQNGYARKAFRLSEGKLMLGGTVYTKDFVEQPSGSLEGVWRHAEGTMGTILFFSGGRAELELAGFKYSGTYTFDDSAEAGTVTVVYGGREWTFGIRLKGGNLVVETGMFIAGDVVYIRDTA